MGAEPDPPPRRVPALLAQATGGGRTLGGVLALSAALALVVLQPLPGAVREVPVGDAATAKSESAIAVRLFRTTVRAARERGDIHSYSDPAVVGVARLGSTGRTLLGVRADALDDVGREVLLYGLVDVALVTGSPTSGRVTMACDAVGRGVAFAVEDIGADGIVALVAGRGDVSFGEGREVAPDDGPMQVWRDPSFTAIEAPAVLHIGESTPTPFC